MHAAENDEVERRYWKLWIRQADLFMAASTFLSGLSFTAVFTVQDPTSLQAVRVFFLVASASSLLATILCACTLCVGRRLLYLHGRRGNDTPAHKISLWNAVLRVIAWAFYLGQALFVFALLMALGGLLRYSIQTFWVAGEVLGIVAISIAVLGCFVILLITACCMFLLGLRTIPRAIRIFWYCCC